MRPADDPAQAVRERPPRASTTSSVFSSLAIYVPSQYAAQFLGILTAVLLRRFLGPFHTGIWNAVQLVMTYLFYSHAGVKTALFYRLPVLNGKGDERGARALQDTAFSFLMGTIVLAAAGLAGYAIMFRRTLSPELFWGFIAGATILLTQRLAGFCVTVLRARREFRILGRSVIYSAALNLAAVAILVGVWGLYGMYACAFLVPLLTAVYIMRAARLRVHWRWDPSHVIQSIRFGLPIFLKDWLMQILNSLDRIMIVSFLGFNALGLFSIAFMTRNYGEGLYKNFSHVITPYLLEDVGRENDIRRSARFVTEPTLILAYFMSILLGALFILSAPLVGAVLPQFTAGVGALRVYLLCTFFVTLTTQGSSFLAARQRQMQLVPIALAAIVLNVALNYGLIRAGYGITGVAWATSLTAAVSFLATYVLALSGVESPAVVIRRLTAILVPPALSAAVLVGLEYGLPAGNIWIRAAWQAAVFAAVCVFLIGLADRQTAIIRRLWNWTRRPKEEKSS